MRLEPIAPLEDYLKAMKAELQTLPLTFEPLPKVQLQPGELQTLIVHPMHVGRLRGLLFDPAIAPFVELTALTIGQTYHLMTAEPIPGSLLTLPLCGIPCDEMPGAILPTVESVLGAARFNPAEFAVGHRLAISVRAFGRDRGVPDKFWLSGVLVTDAYDWRAYSTVKDLHIRLKQAERITQDDLRRIADLTLECERLRSATKR